MRYDHAVIVDGILYKAGEEIPEKSEVVENTTSDEVATEKPKRGRAKK